MISGSTRRLSDGDRAGGAGDPARRWLAMALIVVSAAAGLWVFGHDLDWEARHREARTLGVTAQRNGNYSAARKYFETALANNPYDWETHADLANLLNHHLNEGERALRHYLNAIAYAPHPEAAAAFEDKVLILKLLLSGELENPADALGDMRQAVEAGAMRVFSMRLSPNLREDLATYWQAWNARGAPMVTWTNITSERNGFYDAVMEMDFADGTTMSMHFYCPLRDIWRLELSFP